MKRAFFILAVLCLCPGPALWANNDTLRRPPHPHYKPDNTEKDNCEGKRVNFGFSFAPTFNWMFPATEGYERNGTAGGLRIGIPLNVNLTDGKFYYVSTGVFYEQLSGKMKFLDKVRFPFGAVCDSTDTRRFYTAHYLTIPIGIMLKTKPMHNFYFCFNAGLYTGFCLKNSKQDSYMFTAEGGTQAGGELWSRQALPSDEASLFRGAGYVGLGMEYSVTKDLRAGLFINYNHSFTNYFKGGDKAPNSMTGAPQKAKSGVMEIVLNINFL